MPSKKNLNKRIEELTTSLEKSKSVLDEIRRSFYSMTEDRNEWRKKYELLLHTPEYKADVEAAQKRGEAYAKSKFSAWLLHVAKTWSEESNEK